MLIAAAENYQSRYIISRYTPIGFWLLGLGWLITSESARNFISQQLLLIAAGIVFVWLNLVLSIYFNFQVLNISEQLMSKLDNWPYVKGAYEHYRISKSTVVSHCAFIAFIVIL